MFVITKNKQFFTGIGWSVEANEAKVYDDLDEARETISAIRILYKTHIRGTEYLSVYHYNSVIGKALMLDRLNLTLKKIPYPKYKKVDNIKYFRDAKKAKQFRKQLINQRIETLEKQLNELRNLK